jgi:DNA repair protein RecO (recombination protein O)
MKQQGIGFLINKVNYSETSYVVKIYTLEHGLKSFLFQGAKKKKGSILSPLLPIEFSFYQRNDSQLAKITDLTPIFTLSEVYSNPYKIGIVFFITEILQLTLHDGVEDKILFQFVQEEMLSLDEIQDLGNYPIYWFLEFMKIEGISPISEIENASYLDCENGHFTLTKPSSHFHLSGPEIYLFSKLLHKKKEELLSENISKTFRSQLLNSMLLYASHHYPKIKYLKTIEVLENTWN